MKRTVKEPLVFTLIIIATILLFNPTYNIIDPLPDFIAFLSLALLIRNNGELLPYFKETKEALLKLSLVSFLKIPAMLIMYANLSTGRDIIPLFTLTFGIFELIWLIPAIENGFCAIFYIGERTELDSLIHPYRILGVKTHPDFLKKLTMFFFIARPVLALLPELCMLTFESATLTNFLYRIYVPTLILCLGLSLLLGVFWMSHTIAYAGATLSHFRIFGVIKELAGEERLVWLEDRCRLKSKISHLSLLGISSVFFFDLRFAENQNANILPHFIYGLLLLIVALKLFSGIKLKLSVAFCSLGYAASSGICYFKTIEFLSEYSYIDIEDNPLAARAYELIEALSLAELAFFILLMLTMSIGIVGFVRNNTAVEPSHPAYSKQDRDYHNSMSTQGIIAFFLAALIAGLKCLHVFLEGDAVLIFTEQSAIVSSVAPWLPTVIFALCVIFFIYIMHFVALIKDDVIMKYHRD